jgi:UDP-GlcNAc:undecaprenyl-phosphate GlcNAc-1-phosphate transferase
MEIVGLITLVTAFVLTLFSVMLIKRLARVLRFVDEPGERKVHQTPIPLGGGVAIFIGVFFTIFIAVFSASLVKMYQPSWLPSVVYTYLPGVSSMIHRLTIIFVGAMLIFFVGLVDDIWGLKPRWKLLGQLIVAVYLVLFDIRFSMVITGFEPYSRYIAYAITILWIILITNSLNLLDHMDGLSAGVTAVLSLIFGIAAYQTGQFFIASFLAAILGATLGLLVFNTNPASIFMGDAGSLLLGYLISVLTIIFTFYKAQGGYTLYVLFVPLLVVAVPVFDTIMVILIRLKNRKPIFKGDMNHLAHRLVNLGMSVRSAVFTIYLLTLGTGLPAILLYIIDKNSGLLGGFLILFQVILVLLIITILEQAGRSKNQSNGKT